MPQDSNYHRTFLPDGPIESICRQNCHGKPKPSNRFGDFEPQFLKPRPAFPGANQFRVADLTAREKPYFASQRRRAAYMFVNGELRSIYMVEKIDQEFGHHATLWELQFSALIRDGAERFLPLVDQNYTVVGHVGTVKGPNLVVVPDDQYGNVDDLGSLENYLATEDPVYVARPTPSGWVSYDSKAPYQHYTVVTGIDGEVISGKVTGSDPGAISVEGPVEYITGAALVLRLGAAVARGVIRSLARKLFASKIVRELAGPTKRLLEKVLARRAAAKAGRLAKSGYNPITGMTATHHRAFVAAAGETELIIVVRHTNPKSIPLIERGCPGKPKNLEFINTSPQTGIVMANTAEEVAKAQRLGYLVLRDGQKAQRLVIREGKEVLEDVPLQQPFWALEKGQVIDPKLGKPIVGDYDLMGVIDPRAAGRNIGLVAKNGQLLTDVTNPAVQRASVAVNSRLDIPRVLHGPQDMYKGFRKGASAYMPDGTVMHFETEEAVKSFYSSLGRQPRAGAYPRPAPGTPVKDELAARRRN